MRRSKLLLSLLLVTAGTFFSACGKQEDSAAKNEKIQVVTTFYPMYEFTKQVVGDQGKVELLIPAGTEPHDFEPSAKDLAKIADADAFVYNSPELETWTKDLANSVDKKQTTIIEAAKGIDLMAGTKAEDEHDHAEDEKAEHEHEHEGHQHDHELDSHVWLDPVLASQEVETICQQLSQKYPKEQATFEKNAAAYQKKLAALDQEYQAAFKTAQNKTFVTQHAAFGYLAKQYGLTQEAISGVSPDQEPSPARVSELKHYVEEHDVKVIYFEENATSKVAETLSKETGVRLEVLNPLESLTTKQIKAGEDYISVMEANKKALQESIK